MNSSERIVFNSIVLYAKLIITIIVNLIATRFILNAMGVEDYGIVNLISGIVSMLTFVQNSMAISTQRYMSVNIGKGDLKRQNVIFNNGLFLHLLLGVVILVILEACIPLVFNSAIQIPTERYASSMILYQLTCLGTLLVIVCVPIDATLNAHENMLWVSLASILESAIRLLGAYWLLYYQSDKLVFYGVLVVVIRLASLLFKSFYCKKNYSEVQVQLKGVNKGLLKEMLSFSVWNMFGAFAVAARGQGVAVILNIFNGVVVNSAYGIGQQVSGQLSNFSGTISKSMTPQIMQREGGGHRSAMNSLALKQCHYTSLFVFIFALPLFVEMPYVLQIWLKTVPDYSIDFCRVFALVALMGQLSSGLMTAIQAKGKIAFYQITMSLLLLLNLPAAFFLQKYGYSPTAVMWSMLLIEIICLVSRLLFAHSLVGISFREYAKEVIVKLSVAIIPTSALVVLFKLFVTNQWPPLWQLVISVVLTIVFACLTAYISFNMRERELVRTFIYKIIKKFKYY